jgi:hypothetical protein
VIRVSFSLEAIESCVGFGREQDHEGGADALAASDVDSATRLRYDAV